MIYYYISSIYQIPLIMYIYQMTYISDTLYIACQFYIKGHISCKYIQLISYILSSLYHTLNTIY